MRKELFKHEITLLKDTFGRLLRRSAETNLIKLIKKTHPADLAIIFRYFNDDEKMQVFNLMNSSNHTLEFLIELDDTIIEKLLNRENVDRIAELIQNTSTNDQSYIIGTLSQSQAKSVIDLLKREEIEKLMGYPDDSAVAIVATGRFEVGSELLVLIKELKGGLILGALCGILLGIFTNLKFIETDPMLGLVVGLSIASSMLIAVTVGSFTTLILRKLEIDPAVAAGPFVTPSIDILGVLLYFVIAGILLKI